MFLLVVSILESKNMAAIFQEKGQIFVNMSKNVQNLKIFWKMTGDYIWESYAMNC